MKLRIALLLSGLLGGLVAFGFIVPGAQAQTNSWINPSIGFWQDASSWSLGSPPSPTQSMLITNAGSKTVLMDSSTSSGYSNTLTVSDLILAGQGDSINMLLVDNIGANPPFHILNSLIVNPGSELVSLESALIVDNVASNAVDIEGTALLSGTNFISGGLYVGFPTNAAVPVSVLDGLTAFTNGYMTIGFYGSAQLSLLGGTLQTEDNVSAPNGLFVGFGPGSQGTLSISGGAMVIPENLSLGEDAGATGSLWLNNGLLTMTNISLATEQPAIFTNSYLITIGGNGAGQVTISNGQLAASSMIVGDSAGASGTLTLVGGTLSLSGELVIGQGQSATGAVAITGGQLSVPAQGVPVIGVETGQLSVIVGDFGVGQLTVSNSSLLAQNVIVGHCENSQGTLTIAGGTVSATNLTAGANAYIGLDITDPSLGLYVSNANAIGAIQITGGSLTVTNQSGTGLLTMGQLGNGLLVQSGGSVLADQFALGTASISNYVYVAGSGYKYLIIGGSGQAVVSNGSLAAQSITVGVYTNCQGAVTIAGGQVSVTSNMLVGVSVNATGVIQVVGGNLYVTNQLGTAQLVIGLSGMGIFAQSGGVVTVDQVLATNRTYSITSNLVVQPLWAPVTNGMYSTFTFSSGAFNTMSSMVSNPQTFFVGDGVDSATYNLLGGVHSFANGIEIASNAVLSGCGTVNGSVVVDAGGLIQADCGGTLTFTGIVTNNGTWTALNGSVLESYGPVVNNGLINVLNGNTNFHGSFVNNGILVDQASIPQIVSLTVVGSDVQIEFTTGPKLMYILEYTGDIVAPAWSPLVGLTGEGGNVILTDFGATQQTQRFYRVHMAVPPIQGDE
jgi:hypothetical protein